MTVARELVSRHLKRAGGQNTQAVRSLFTDALASSAGKRLVVRSLYLELREKTKVQDITGTSSTTCEKVTGHT